MYKSCNILPENFQQDITALFQDMFTHPDRVGSDLDRLTGELEKVL